VAVAHGVFSGSATAGASGGAAPFGVIFAGTDLDPAMLAEGNPILVFASGMDRVARIMFGARAESRAEPGGWAPVAAGWTVAEVPREGATVVAAADEKLSDCVEVRGGDGGAFLLVPAGCRVHTHAPVLRTARAAAVTGAAGPGGSGR